MANVRSSSTENLEYIRCPTVSIWAGNPSICIIRHEEIRTASKGNLQTISMPSRANRSSNHLHTNRGRTNRDNAGKNAMILFTTLARLDSSIEKEILIWEMENSKEEDKLFICRIRKTLQKYNLPSPEEILGNPPKKRQWKNAMKKAINMLSIFFFLPT
jgi:hypothetical protein